MRTKKSITKSPNAPRPTLDCVLADAMDLGLMQVLGEMTPRHYVALRTMSQFEIGQRGDDTGRRDSRPSRMPAPWFRRYGSFNLRVGPYSRAWSPWSMLAFRYRKEHICGGA
jgi:hypothetical protein